MRSVKLLAILYCHHPTVGLKCHLSDFLLSCVVFKIFLSGKRDIGSVGGLRPNASGVVGAMITQTSACKCGLVSLLAMSSAALAQTPTNPVPEQSAPAMAAAAGLLIYPKNDQSQEQQSADRYACHSWAQGQTGFDPTEPNIAASSSQLASRRSDYRRAMSACLEARGYSVRYAAPTAAPLPPPASPVPPPAPPFRVEHYTVPSPELKYHPFEVHIDGGYSVTTGTTNQNFENGSNAGLGFADRNFKPSVRTKPAHHTHTLSELSSDVRLSAELKCPL
jgi:hypothetical protein